MPGPAVPIRGAAVKLPREPVHQAKPHDRLAPALTACLCWTGPCGTRQRKKDSTQMQKGCTRNTQMGLSPAWPFTAGTAGPHPGSRADAVARVPSACFACICLHLR
jgi:hypothetical protein